eukprot:CAMPEP_0117513726 /NCGR_PEP_ID=MMETSP0784-20121206/29705_1 /TAXON_ID=39447 /ORGANISM="" /LENGTH=527 /DNA_ID=CAMNT_0005309505 /DNA_START=31 /DNA_END=1614 /DNA_ORIENTATION=-
MWRHLQKERLLWVCAESAEMTLESLGPLFDKIKVNVRQLFRPEKLESLGFLKLQIPPYTAEQLGAAYERGPVGLDVVVTMCGELRRVLADAEAEESVCVACSRHPGAIVNSLLLLGAFLVLERGLPAADVCQQLFGPHDEGGKLPTLKFPTPWKPAGVNRCDSLTVQDCLFGLEAAVAHGWLDYANFNVQARRAMSHATDAEPIFVLNVASPDVLEEDGETPRRSTRVTFWVAADPVTTVMHPHFRPEGLSIEDEDVPEKDSPRPNSVSSPQSECFSRAAGRTSQHSESSYVTISMMSVISPQSIDPSKEWRARTSDRGDRKLRQHSAIVTPTKPCVPDDGGRGERRVEDLPAFGRWLRVGLRCRMLVRANFLDEKGLPGGSYSDFFERRGVHQVHLPFLDGTAPPSDLVEELISEVVALLHQLQFATQALSSRQSGHEKGTEYSVMIHCKSGFGRSMCLLGALAISLVPGLSGAAFFGWARLARPGSIQTEAQERFLRAMDEKSNDLPCGRCRRAFSSAIGAFSSR